jgi:hypothetical protein
VSPDSGAATPAPPRYWRTPEELVAIGFERSRVVMMNEAHHMLLRSVRTREVGRRVLPAAHAAGARYLAMEALSGDIANRANDTRTLPEVEGGYLSQPEMRAFVETALDLGWALIAYEAHPLPPPGLDPSTREAADWRDDQQARNLIEALAALPAASRMLVWCGNGHHAKRPLADWRPMGVRFAELSGDEAFAIDQACTVEFPGITPHGLRWVEAYPEVFVLRGRAVGFLSEDAPPGWAFPEAADAFILAADNAMA